MENRIMKTERPQKGKMSVLEEISRIITGSRRPEDALNRIVVLVAGKFSTDVCSVYLLDKEKKPSCFESNSRLAERNGRKDPHGHQ
jgi:signal transduction protein with GAF and PtsI domain